MDFLNSILLEVGNLQHRIELILISLNNINKVIKKLLKHKVLNRISYYLKEEVYQCKVEQQIIDCK